MSRMVKPEGRRARRKFTDEFKAGVVRLVLDEGKTAGAVARELDLTDSAVREWVARAQAERTKGKARDHGSRRERNLRRPWRVFYRGW
jgi:transposase